MSMLEWKSLQDKLDGLEQGIRGLKTDLTNVFPTSQRSFTATQAEKRKFSSFTDDEGEARGSSGQLAAHRRNHPVPPSPLPLSDIITLYENRLTDKSSPTSFDPEKEKPPFIGVSKHAHMREVRIKSLCNRIPVDSECLELCRTYHEIHHVFFPGITDIQQFQGEVAEFLKERRNSHHTNSNESHNDEKVFGKSIHWMGLLFGVLCSGCQCTNRTRKESQLVSQAYMNCSYGCLQLVDYLSNPTLIDIQTLLILGNVLADNAKVEVAWPLTGVMMRLAQILGLDRDPPDTMPLSEKLLRKDIWRQVVWQDSLLSISCGKASFVPSIDRLGLKELPSHPMTYADCMSLMCRTGLEIIEKETKGVSTPSAIWVVDTALNDAVEHLKEEDTCRSTKDYLEHWNLQMHRSYINSELSRHALGGIREDNEHFTDLLDVRMKMLTQTVSALIELQKIIPANQLSIRAIEWSLNSAVHFCHIGEANDDQAMRRTIGDYLEVMSQQDLSDMPTRMATSLELLKQNIQPSAFTSHVSPT